MHDDAKEDRLIGTTIGEKYRVIRRLGEGGMGAVYEGEHTLIKRRVAIKVLHAELTTSADVIMRFHREAMAATQVGHEHIVEVTDMGRLADGGPFMILEYLDGRDLAREISERGRLSVARVAHIARQMCDGLAAAHDKGIVHRDLKPENVFLISRGGDPHFVKILDFGISKILDARDADQKSDTRTGSVLGTGYYMAPEQAMGNKDLDHRADVWALGVVIFRALTGEYPFDADTYAGLLVRVVTDEPRSLRELRPNLPDAVYAIVDRCLSKKPADRWPDCRALSRALAPLETDEGVDVLAKTSIGVPGAVTPRAPTDASPVTMPLPAAEPIPPPQAPVVVAPELALPRALAPASPSGPPSRVAPIALALAAAVGVGAVAVRFLPDGSTRPDPVTVPTAVAPDAWALSPPDAATFAVGRSTVHVHIATDPPSATVTLDGAALPTPFDDDLPRGADMHVLETSAEGYRTDRRELSLLFAQDITITLVTGHGVTETRTHHTTGHPPTTTSETPAITTTPPITTTHETPPDPLPPVHVDPPALPDGVIVPPEDRVLKHLRGH